MAEPGRRLKEESEWYKIYSTTTHPQIYESKFASEEAHISLPELQSLWQHWQEGEKVQFAKAFGYKHNLNGEDAKVLEFLMQQEDGRICAMVAMLSTKYPDRTRAVEFLTHCVETFPRDRPNFVQALSRLGAPEVIPVLSRLYEVSDKKSIDDIQDENSLIDLLYAAAGLYKLLGNRQYRQTIIRFLDHPGAAIRASALLCMREIEDGN